MIYEAEGASTSSRVCMAKQTLITNDEKGAVYVYDGVKTTAAFCDGASFGISTAGATALIIGTCALLADGVL